MDDSITTTRAGFQQSLIKNPLIMDHSINEEEKRKNSKKPLSDIIIEHDKKNITVSKKFMDFDLENSEFIFSQLQRLENNDLFGMAQKSPGEKKIALLLS